MPPWTPLTLWIRECERVVLKEFTDGEKTFECLLKVFKKLCAGMERTIHAQDGTVHTPVHCKTVVKPHFSCYMTKERS